jgi:hypothetical protein
MSRETSSGLEVAFALIFAAAIWIFQISLFITRVARNLRAEWDQHDQPSQGNEKK